jgi:carbamoyl-phosphate synthase small subunit
MNAIISSEITDLEELKKRLAEVPSMAGLELSSIVSTKESYEAGDPSAEMKIAALRPRHKKQYCELHGGDVAAM